MQMVEDLEVVVVVEGMMPWWENVSKLSLVLTRATVAVSKR
jgi:hypothetical protein